MCMYRLRGEDGVINLAGGNSSNAIRVYFALVVAIVYCMPLSVRIWKTLVFDECLVDVNIQATPFPRIRIRVYVPRGS